MFHLFIFIFILRKQVSPICWEVILLIYSMVCLNGCNMYRVLVEIMCLRTEISCISRGNDASETLKLTLSKKKNDSPRKQYTNVTLGTTKFPPLIQTLSLALSQNSVRTYYVFSFEGRLSPDDGGERQLGTGLFIAGLCTVLSRGRFKMTNQD